MSWVGRIARGVLGLAALLALVLAVPWFLVRAVGNPWPGRAAIDLRDQPAILLGVLAAAAWVVWARFLVAVAREVAVQGAGLRHDRAAGSGPRGAIAGPVAPAPAVSTGGGLGLLAQHLVALALTLLPLAHVAAPSSGSLPLRSSAVAAASVATPSAPVTPRVSSATDRALPVVDVQANDSLFRIAERHLGDRTRWREILDLNTDRVQPDGARLATPSSLRSGWSLVLPADATGVLSEPAVSTPAPYVVAPGDSYWEIAERELTVELQRPPSAVEVADRAHTLMEVNAPVLGYANPAMLRPGDEVMSGSTNPAVAAAPLDAHTRTHIVESGESYWSITADELELSLGRPVSGAEVLVATTALVDANAPLFAYDDPAMLHPGDEVVLPESAWPPPIVGEVPSGDAVVESPAAVPTTPVVDAAPAPALHDPPMTTTSAELPATSEVLTPPTAAPPAAPPDGGTLGPARGEAIPQPTPPAAATEPGLDALLGEEDHSPGLALALGLGGAVLVAGGTLALVDARRRASLRRATAHAQLLAGEPDHTEVSFRVLGAADRLLRLDLALRALAVVLRDHHAQPTVVIVHGDGTVAALLSGAATSAPPWVVTGDRWWTLPGSIGLEDIAAIARGSGVPCPSIVHLGTSDGADLYLDVESVGVLSIDGPDGPARRIMDALALGLAVSPFTTGAALALVGVDDGIDDVRADVERCVDADGALAVVRATLGTIAAATSMGATTFELRARSTVERWEPAIVLLGGAADRMPDDLVTLAGSGGRGVAVVSAVPIDTGAVVRRAGSGWVLDPWGIAIDPVGVEPDDVAAVVRLLDDAEREQFVVPEPFDQDELRCDLGPGGFEEREWELLVRVLGGVRVHDGAGVDARFDRGKAQELVCWLALHRRTATRAGARTALWETDVRDATFANVVSDARRSLARLAPPPDGEEWVGRTLSESLPLHPLVVTDADLLGDRVAAARGQTADVAVALLRPGLALVNDLPFAGTGYLWPDVEGSVTELILLATTAAVEMGRHCLQTGDVEGLFWATGQGLSVLPGHEELVALRMRAHAREGDLAAVRAEWGSYERALAADPWSDAEPAPKLVDLRRDLLGPATTKTPA